MFVLLGVVLADDEMGNVGGKVILVKTAEFENLAGKICLSWKCSVRGAYIARAGREDDLTRSLAGMLVQHTTMPWNGLDGSKVSSSNSDDRGGDSIMELCLLGPWSCDSRCNG